MAVIYYAAMISYRGLIRIFVWTPLVLQEITAGTIGLTACLYPAS